MRTPLFQVFISAMLLQACSATLEGQLLVKGQELSHLSPDARVNVAPLSRATPPIVLEVDGKGGFALNEDLPDGQYLIEALVPGYKVASKTITISGAEGSPQVIMNLSAIEKRDTKSFKANIGDGSFLGQGSAALTPPSL